MKILVSNSRTPADIGLDDPDKADSWAHYIAEQLAGIRELTRTLDGETRQIGAKAGTTGHGYSEGFMPAKLWAALERRDPDLLTNEKKWAQLRRDFPMMFLPLPKKVF